MAATAARRVVREIPRASLFVYSTDAVQKMIVAAYARVSTEKEEQEEDSVLMDDITDLLNGLIRNPAIIRSVLPRQSEPSVEQRRLDNEIARTLEGYDFDKEALREKLYQRAAIGYQQIGNEAYVEYKLKNALEQHDILDGFDSELTNKTVKLIRLTESGSVSIILSNDQVIRKEQTNYANNSSSDAT